MSVHQSGIVHRRLANSVRRGISLRNHFDNVEDGNKYAYLRQKFHSTHVCTQAGSWSHRDNHHSSRRLPISQRRVVGIFHRVLQRILAACCTRVRKLRPGLVPQCVDGRLVLGPFHDEPTTVHMRTRGQRLKCILRFLRCEEVDEGKPAVGAVELLWHADALELAERRT